MDFFKFLEGISPLIQEVSSVLKMWKVLAIYNLVEVALILKNKTFFFLELIHDYVILF